MKLACGKRVVELPVAPCRIPVVYMSDVVGDVRMSLQLLLFLTTKPPAFRELRSVPSSLLGPVTDVARTPALGLHDPLTTKGESILESPLLT